MDRKSAAGGKGEAAGVISCPTDSTDTIEKRVYMPR